MGKTEGFSSLLIKGAMAFRLLMPANSKYIAVSLVMMPALGGGTMTRTLHRYALVAGCKGTVTGRLRSVPAPAPI